MAPSDLNAKKSWNPKLYKNRERVWQKEREIFEQYTKQHQHNIKLNEINEKGELLSLAKGDSKDTEKKNNKTSWMYQNLASSNDPNAQMNEDVLLGKRNLDNAMASSISKTEQLKSSRIDKVLKTGIDKEMVTSETLSKSDPLYMVKLQQLKRKEALEKQRKIEKYQKKKSEKHEHKHRHRHEHREDNRDKREHRSHDREHDRENRDHDRKYRDHKSRDRDPERSNQSYRDRR